MAQGTFDKEIMDAILAENEIPTSPPVTAEQIARLYSSRVQEKDPSWLQRAWNAIGLGDAPYALPDRTLRDPEPGTGYIKPEELSGSSSGRGMFKPKDVNDIEPDKSIQLPSYPVDPMIDHKRKRQKQRT